MGRAFCALGTASSFKNVLGLLGKCSSFELVALRSWLLVPGQEP